MGEIDSIDTVLVKIMPQKKKETVRDSKNVMFAQTTQNMNLSKTFTHLKKEDIVKARNTCKRDPKQLSLCESLKLTIHQNRISYISTYNTEIFNGVNLIKEV